MPADLGKMGPHPNVLEIVAEARRTSMPYTGAPIMPDEFQVLQQRTFYELKKKIFRRPEEVSTVDTTVVLAILGGRDRKEELLMFQLIRVHGEGWGMSQFGGGLLENPPTKPWTTMGSVSQMFGISFGAVIHRPDDVGKVRVELADGTIAEDTVSNNSLLLFVPFRSPDAWASDALVELYTPQGRKIVTHSVPAIGG